MEERETDEPMVGRCAAEGRGFSLPPAESGVACWVWSRTVTQTHKHTNTKRSAWWRRRAKTKTSQRTRRGRGRRPCPRPRRGRRSAQRQRVAHLSHAGAPLRERDAIHTGQARVKRKQRARATPPTCSQSIPVSRLRSRSSGIPCASERGRTLRVTSEWFIRQILLR